MNRTNTIPLYQILYDVGVQQTGYLVINPLKVDETKYHDLLKRKRIFHQGSDIYMDFGITKHTFRFSLLTDEYLSIAEIVSRMIVTSLDTYKKGIDLTDLKSSAPDNDQLNETNPDLRRSVDNTQLFLPEGMIMPSGLATLFVDSTTVHYYHKSLPQVGRLGDILYAGNYSFEHDGELSPHE